MIYLDSDGVFANWQKHIINKHLPRYGINNIKEINKLDTLQREKVFSDIYKRDPHIFYRLDVIPQSHVLLDYVIDNGLDWRILTATTNPNWLNYNIAIDDKLAWWKEHFDVDPDKIIVVSESNKKLLYCKPGDILIDDFDDTCRCWQNHGGVSIFVESNIYDVNDVIKQLDYHLL